MKIRVYVRPKDGVLDPQGETVRQALNDIGFAGVTQVRQGKVFEIDLQFSYFDPDVQRQYTQRRDIARQDVQHQDIAHMCEKLLANPIIEDYEIDLDDEGESSRS